MIFLSFNGDVQSPEFLPHRFSARFRAAHSCPLRYLLPLGFSTIGSVKARLWPIGFSPVGILENHHSDHRYIIGHEMGSGFAMWKIPPVSFGNGGLTTTDVGRCWASIKMTTVTMIYLYNFTNKSMGCTATHLTNYFKQKNTSVSHQLKNEKKNTSGIHHREFVFHRWWQQKDKYFACRYVP